MKKKLFTLLFALVAIATAAQAQVVLNAENFPNANFRKALASKLGISEGDEITDEMIAATTKLDVSSKSIADLTGIEHFTALTMLDCWNNRLTSLDVSKNTALTSLACRNNQLTSLDLSKNTALTQLYCHNNQLTTLDVSKNTALTSLVCRNNQLTSLDVSKNTALELLDCLYNQLTALDVSKNTALTELDCSYNQLTSLNVSGCTALKSLYCYNNHIKGEAMDALVASLPVSQGYFFVINTKNTNEGNVCTKAQVAVAKGKGWIVNDYDIEYEGSDDATGKLLLNAENFPDANFRAALATKLRISEGDEITEAKIAATTSLDVSRYGKPDKEKIADLTGIEHFTALTYLSCRDNQLTALDVSKNTALTTLSCRSNQLTELDVSKNTALNYLYCQDNQLTALDVSKNTALTELYCFSNQIKGAAMDALVGSLPTVSKGSFYVIDTKDENEGNVCTKAQVAVAKGKGWTVYDFNGRNRQEYEGSEDSTAKLLLNAENFPDANFRAALASILKISEGDEITEAKIAATISLDVNSKPIADLTGIEYFTALTALRCYRNQLTSLDVSKNTKLTSLFCYMNQLTSLDVSKNTKLTGLRCDGNQLTALDVSKNTALKELNCLGNQLTSLDVSKNTALTTLWCDDNQLTSLDVSKNTALTKLGCDNNQLTALDVSKNTKLTYLSCSSNQLTSLDVSKNTKLTSLFCYMNQLTSLDVSKNTTLTDLDCGHNQLTALDVSKNTKLTGLRCYGNQIKGEAMDALVASLPTVSKGSFYVIDTKDENEGNVCTKSQVAVAKGKGWTVYDFNGRYSNRQEYEGSEDSTAKLLLNAEHFPDANFRAALATILGISEGDEITEEKIAATTSLDVSEKSIADLTGIEHFTALTELYCLYNQLTALDVSKNTALTELGCFNNQLTLLNVSGCTALTTLICDDNQLTSLDVSKNTALIFLHCGYNQLTSLDVSGCSALFRLYCDNNQLNSLDVTGCTALKYLFCDNNQLNSLDVSGCTALVTLWCFNNQLTLLNVSGCTALTTLMCDNNQLTSLDVSKNTALTTLWCFNNQLTLLNVSGCTALTSLNCFSNKLTALDVSKNTALEYLSCINNQIKGKEMDALVASLPTVESSNFYVIDTKNENEGNVCTKAQVAVAKGKGWTVYDNNGGSEQEYEGSDDTTAIDASLNDNGKMINDNYYSIDGVKLSGEPTKKGVYIHKGKKVKK